jgi:hypothetical protein
MSLTTIEKAIQAARREAVIAEITERGAMTGKELMAAIPSLTKGILPAMVKHGVLESRHLGMSDCNGNKITLYALPGKECARVEVEPGPTLFDLWPVPVPSVTGNLRRVEERHSYGWHVGISGLQSCHGNLIMMGGE